MSKVLFLTQVLPYPLDSGAKFRAYYVLRWLAQTHEVTLVSFVRADDSPAAIAHLRSICDAVYTVPMQRSPLRNARALLKAGLTGQSVIIVRDEILQMQALLRDLVQRATASGCPFDVIHADQTAMAQYALYAERLSRAESRKANVGDIGPRLVLDAHNALYRIPERMAAVATRPLRRWGLQREARALQHYETAAYRRFNHVVFVTEVDRRELWKRRHVKHHGSHIERPRLNAENTVPTRDGELSIVSSGPTTSVIPICIEPESQPLIPRCAAPRDVVHVGTMFWPPNVEGVRWFAQEVFPQVLAQTPDARFVIVGKNPPPSITDLAVQMPNTVVTGYVPDPAPYLADAAAFIVPLHAGGGMRVKIIDAWCWGVPIVTTTIGAEGIAIRDGENILVADTPTALADAVRRLMTDPALGERLRARGRTWVEAHYDWRKIYPAWDDVYCNVLTQGDEAADGSREESAA